MLQPQTQKPLLYDAFGQPFSLSASAYHAASLRDRALASWNPPAGSPDADILPDLDTLRTRSRDLIRNHGVAGGAIADHGGLGGGREACAFRPRRIIAPWARTRSGRGSGAGQG